MRTSNEIRVVKYKCSHKIKPKQFCQMCIYQWIFLLTISTDEFRLIFGVSCIEMPTKHSTFNNKPTKKNHAQIRNMVACQFLNTAQYTRLSKWNSKWMHSIPHIDELSRTKFVRKWTKPFVAASIRLFLYFSNWWHSTAFLSKFLSIFQVKILMYSSLNIGN